MRVGPSQQNAVRPDPQTPEPRASFADLLQPPGTAPVDPLVRTQETPLGPTMRDAVAPAPLGTASDTPDSDGESRVAAAAFYAFGMFGRRAGVTALEALPVSGPGKASPMGVSEAPSYEPSGPPVASAAGSWGSAGAPGGNHRHLARPEAFQPVRLAAQADGPSGGEAPAINEMIGADDADAGPVASRRPASRKSADAETTARLTLSDAADAAGLAVRLAGLSAEEVAQFRARARTLLGEHGLRLSTLDINGEDRSGSDLPTGGITQWR